MPRRIGTRPPLLRRPPAPAVGAAQLQPVGGPQTPARAKQKRSRPKDGVAEPRTTLWRPKPPNTVIARRHYVPPPQEVDAVLGGAPLTTRPEARFASLNDAQMGNATRIGARPQS